MGFAVPLARWFRGPLRQAMRNAVLGPVLAETGWFNLSYLRRLVDDHQSGLRDYSATLWTRSDVRIVPAQRGGRAGPMPAARAVSV